MKQLLLLVKEYLFPIHGENIKIIIISKSFRLMNNFINKNNIYF